jgi:hypothetical protein
MATLKFTFTLSSGAGLTPKIQIWVDSDGDGAMADTEEVPLQRNGLCWSGDFSVPDARVDGAAFLVTYLANPPNGWRLIVTSDEQSLYDQQGQITGSSHGFIVGACS